jgi:hypothetical protein
MTSLVLGCPITCETRKQLFYKHLFLGILLGTAIGQSLVKHKNTIFVLGQPLDRLKTPVKHFLVSSQDLLMSSKHCPEAVPTYFRPVGFPPRPKPRPKHLVYIRGVGTSCRQGRLIKKPDDCFSHFRRLHELLLTGRSELCL